jgi:hypothetical protein
MMMHGRHHRESIRRLRHLASEVPLNPDMLQKLLQPIADEWRPLQVPNLKDALIPMGDELRLSPSALTDLAARIRVIGMNLNKSGLKGIEYHNALQRQLASLAATFDCQGFTESAALFSDPASVDDAAPQLAGRVDVLWARHRQVVAVFEVDSTAKDRSLQKLKEAAAPHKFWVYFGKDLWNFRTFLQTHDAAREIISVIVPRTFVPSFEEQQDN